MKEEFQSKPQFMDGMETHGFSWINFLTAIPSPSVLKQLKIIILKTMRLQNPV
jgi:hypothetical protein